ncbi:MAG: DUF2179 domain-containing protein [Chloroflexi bacterium]|nr:DUF2179 domain-containing protein [Chloroflexota bacterium]
MTTDAILLAAAIFGLRVVNNMISTLRVVFITRQMKLVAAVMAFLEAWIFAVVISSVVQDLGNTWNLLAYCGGFAVGSYVGMWIESRFITSYMIVNVFVRERGHEIAQALRAQGFGVTETSGEGREGAVMILRSVITSRDVPRFSASVRELLPDAFIAIEEARAVQQGWITRHSNGHQR